MVNDSDAIAEALGFFDVMSGHYDGFLFTAELFDDVINFAAHLRIEAGGGLIEEKHFGIVDQRHRQSEALFLASGELAVKGIALFFAARSA